MSPIIISLPWPPSINHYYLRRGNRTFIGSKGLIYRRIVDIACQHYRHVFSADKRLRMELVCYPPDRRRRDLDNLGKCAIDSLQHAKVFVDDYQIDHLIFKRMPELLGKVLVHIGEI